MSTARRDGLDEVLPQLGRESAKVGFSQFPKVLGGFDLRQQRVFFGQAGHAREVYTAALQSPKTMPQLPKSVSRGFVAPSARCDPGRLGRPLARPRP